MLKPPAPAAMIATPPADALAAPLAPEHGPRMHPGRAFAGLILANIFLACGPWLVRSADVGPVASGFWRLTIGVPLLLVATRLARQPVPRLPTGALLAIAIAGACFALDLAFWHIGIFRTRLTNATLFGNCTSFLFAGYGFLVARAWPSRRQAGALLLALAGMLLLAGRSYELSPERLVGDLLCLLAGIFYTGYLVVLDRARIGIPPWPLLLLATVFGVLTLAPMLPFLGEPWLPHRWAPLVLLAIGSQVAGQGLILQALGRVQPVVIALCLLIQPVINAAIGWIGYGERLGVWDFAGAGAIGAALVLVRERR